MHCDLRLECGLKKKLPPLFVSEKFSRELRMSRVKLPAEVLEETLERSYAALFVGHKTSEPS